MAFPCRHQDDDTNVDVHSAAGTPLRYASLDHVYSATSPCVSASGSSNVMSKKVKARKLMTVNHFDDDDDDEQKMTTTDMTESFSDKPQPPLIHVYSRRVKKLRHSGETTSVYDSLLARAESKSEVLVGEDCGVEDSKVGKDCGVEDSKVGRLLLKKKKRGNLGIGELVKLGVDENCFRVWIGLG